MSQIGSLTASNPTTFRLSYVPEFILIDAVDSDLVVDSISVSVQGGNPQNITDQTVIQAMSKYLMAGILGADVKAGQIIKIADGQIDLPTGQQFTVVLGNAGATTPDVYAFSNNIGSRVFEKQQNSINANANSVLAGMDVLFFENTNFSKATINYQDGHTESDLGLNEIAALNVLNPNTRATDADGKLAGVNVIDFNGLGIASVQLFAGSGGALPYYTFNF